MNVNENLAVKAARAEYGSDDIQIDYDAALSAPIHAEGVWVAAWVWVTNEMIEAHK